MAAILAEIKSRMLLPRIADAENTEEDPRAELVRRLQEYERFKKAAENLDQLPREEREEESGNRGRSKGSRTGPAKGPGGNRPARKGAGVSEGGRGGPGRPGQ